MDHELDPSEFEVITHLFSAGPTRETANGEEPLGWEGLLAYATLTGLAFPSPMFALLRLTSREYLVARMHGEKPLAIPPSEQ